MGKKNHSPGPVPPNNKSSHGGPPAGKPASKTGGGEPDSNLDPKHRKGDFTGKGDAPIVQPGAPHGQRDANG